MTQIVAIKANAINFDTDGSFTYDSARSWPLFPTKCTVSMKCNGLWSLDMQVPFDKSLNDYIVKEGIIAVTMRKSLTESIGINKVQAFRITKADKGPYLFTAEATQVFYDARQYMVNDHIHIVDKMASDAIKELITRCKAPIGFSIEQDKQTATAYWEWKNMLECINDDEDNSFINRWGGDFVTDNYRFLWRRKLDRFRNSPDEELIRISAGLSMTNIKYTIDTSKLVTEIWPQAYNGHHLEPKEGVFTSVRSPHFNDYAVGYPTIMKYEKIRLKEDAGSSEDKDIIVCDTKDKMNQELIKASEKEFTENKVDVPSITYDVDFSDLTQVTRYKGYESLITLCLGDSCIVYNEDLDINTKARVKEITYDCVNELVTKMTLGDYNIDYYAEQARQNRTARKVLNTPLAAANADTVTGVIDGQKAQMAISLDKNNQNGYQVVKVENTLKGTGYGAIAIGSDGVQATTVQQADGSGWNWKDSTLFNQKGIWFGKVGNSDGSKYIKFDKNGLQSYDGGVFGKGITGTFVGDSFHVTNGIVTGQTQWKPITYELSVNDNMLTLSDSNGNAQTVKLPEMKTIITGDKGETGAQGPKGDKGDTATVTVGTVTTGSAGTNAIVTNSGTTNDAIFNFQIPKGDKGDSLTIKSYTVEYQEGTSSVEAPIGAWMTKPMDILQGNYLWTRITLNFSDGTTAQYYSVARQGIDGVKGATGKTGDTGKGVKSITHYYLATGLNTSVTRDSDGWTTDVQLTDSVKKYLWTYSKTLWTDNSTTVTDPVIIGSYGTKGDTGPQGNPGAKGDPGKNGTDGVSPIVSVSKSGGVTTISITDKNGTHTQTVSDGTNGTPGAKGADGKTPYFHVKYSNDGGKTFTGNSGEDVGTYIGTCTDYNSADPTTVSSYTWARIKGDTGAQGQRGPSGTSSFLHIAYANSNDGKIGFSHTWSKSKTWVGHYVTDVNEADSDDPTKYTWVKWVGDDGIGITDIIEYYNVNSSATTAPTSWSTTVQQPNATSRYLWNYEEIKFSSGESHKSTPRVIGVYSNSITKITPYYYLSNSRDTFTLVSGHSWTTTIPNISDGEYLWEKMIVTFDNGSTKETEPVLHGEYNALSEGMNIISSNVDSQIDNAQDHILQQVYSTYATKDALNEYKSSMNTQFGIYDGKISANISELNSVKSNVADLTETANNVNNYMTFDKNGLSLGKSDSDFKTNITNEKLAFLQNGNEVAYFANNQMYVTDGNFANSMTIGKFAFVPRANGSLDFKKVGK
ncbi:phage tail spike protein [Absicoccus intestinalis]|uniref:Tail spike domain-containing protein n=1 Tax=Absicoccus intestinalis TaxID=2926319 RepID=A0ABU4WPM2_9FIRM|nr:phage tail spike protein [Absicoccus sp. CLA-KB-P134]MDX8417359.1 hypothetical protein [Absicoccus sp. CLA-KB-P134]